MEEFKKYLNAISPIEEKTFGLLHEHLKMVELQKNEFFVREGEYAKRIGFLMQGVARAFFINKDGKEYTKQFFVGPSIVGAYSSLLMKQPNKIAQQALTRCQILTIEFNQIESLYDKHHDLERLGRKMAELYFLEKEQKELEMALLDADKRYLLMRERFPTVESTIPQYHIASYLGISPTQLSRIRKKLSHS